jgi:hypothetical protein
MWSTDRVRWFCGLVTIASFTEDAALVSAGLFSQQPQG